MSLLHSIVGQQGRDTVWRTVQIFSVGAVSFFLLFISAKLLTPEIFGVLNYLLALIWLFSVFSDAGLSTSVSRYTAEYLTSRPKSLSNIIPSVFLVVVVVGAAISALVLLYARVGADENFAGIVYLLPCLFLMPFASILDGFYRGLKKFRKLALAHIGVGLSVIFLAYLLIRSYLFIGALAAFNLLYLLLTVVLLLSRGKIGFKPEFKLLKPISSYAVWVGLGSLAYFIYSRVDMLILEQFGYVVEIGYYGIIDKVFAIFYMPAVALGQVVAPDTARHMVLQEHDHVKKLLSKYFRITAVVSLLLAASLYFVLPLLLRVFLPDYYKPSYLLILNILLLLIPFKVWGSVLIHGFITPTGYITITTVMTLIGGLLNVVFDYVTIMYWGFIGVFWTTLAVHSMVIVVTSLIFLRKFSRGM